jgi:hypothetical protein
MVSIIATIVIVAGVAIYLMNPTFIQNLFATVAHWFR